LTTLILAFRGSPDLPAVRLVQQEPSLLRRAFRGRTLVCHRSGRTMATPHTLLELYSQLRIQLPTLPLFTFQRTRHRLLRIAD
jgi:hypothetical protein